MSFEEAFEIGRLRQPLVEIADAGNDIYTAFTLLPGLRGFWPMSAVDSSGVAIDQSGHGHGLTANGTPLYNAAGAPYVLFGGTADYLSHIDHANLDILGTEANIDTSIRGLTLGGWFWFNAASLQLVMGKWNGSVNQRAYLLRHTASSTIQFDISTDGLAFVGVASSGTVSTGAWHFCVGRFMPSVSTSVFVNGEKTSGSSATAVFNSTAQLEIGRANTLYMNGRASLCFLCASALPDDLIDSLYQKSRSLFGV